GPPNAQHDIDGTKMDGFVRSAENARLLCRNVNKERCSFGPLDVMGYHTGSEIPNYWTYARDFVLQDHMFEPAASWSLPAHLFLGSAWAARCTSAGDPMSCASDIAEPDQLKLHKVGSGYDGQPDYAWTDLTWMLHQDGVSWAYYVAEGTEPDCDDDAAVTCPPIPQHVGTPEIWDPLPFFDT